MVTEDSARSWKRRKLVYSCNFQVYCIKRFIHKHIQMTTSLIVRCSLACVRHCTSDADHSLSAEPTFTCQFPRISYLHLSLTSMVFLLNTAMSYLVSYYFLTYTLVSQTRYTTYSGVRYLKLNYIIYKILVYISYVQLISSRFSKYK